MEMDMTKVMAKNMARLSKKLCFQIALRLDTHSMLALCAVPEYKPIIKLEAAKRWEHVYAIRWLMKFMNTAENTSVIAAYSYWNQKHRLEKKIFVDEVNDFLKRFGVQNFPHYTLRNLTVSLMRFHIKIINRNENCNGEDVCDLYTRVLNRMRENENETISVALDRLNVSALEAALLLVDITAIRNWMGYDYLAHSSLIAQITYMDLKFQRQIVLKILE